VEPPVSKIMDLAMSNLGYDLTIEQGTRFKLQDIMEDGILFNDFLLFLGTSPNYDSNSLLCSRMITIYYNLIDEAITLASLTQKESENEDEILTKDQILTQNVMATDQVWKIYEHFVAERSARQIPISESMRMAIERKLALPTANMFVNIDAMCTKDLVTTHVYMCLYCMYVFLFLIISMHCIYVFVHIYKIDVLVYSNK
jgi:hypothetical protein